MRLHEITQLLTESRLDYLIKNYSTQVSAQLSEDYTFREILGSYQNNSQKYDQSAIYWITDLMNKDPSHNGMYTQWMLIQYIKGNFEYEDSGNLLDDLEYFHVNKRAFEQKDINQYTVDELYNAVKQIEDQDENISSNRQQEIKVKQEAERVLDTENVLVIHPKTMEAAQYYGKGTRWCTSAINNNLFDSYNNDGPLYIIIDKSTNKKYQIHFETYSIMDAQDNKVDVKEFIEMYPEVVTHFHEQFKEQFPTDYLTETEIQHLVDENTHIVLETENVLIINPLTPLAFHYGIMRYRESFSNYPDDKSTFNDMNDTVFSGLVYIIYDKHKKSETFELSFESGHYQALGNTDPNLDTFLELYPEVYEHFEEEFKDTWPIKFMSLEEKLEKVENNAKVLLDTDIFIVLNVNTQHDLRYFITSTFINDVRGNYKFINLVINKHLNRTYILDFKNQRISFHLIAEIHPKAFIEAYPEVYKLFKKEFKKYFNI